MNQTNLPLIIQQAAKAHFLDFYDQLTDGHVKVLLNNYDPDTGRQFGVLDFELAVDEVQLLCQLVGQRQFGQVPLSSDDDAEADVALDEARRAFGVEG